MRSDKKKAVLKVLKENPKGLTIQDISKKAKMSRITATVYIQGLLGEGVLSERRVGAYRMIYLKEKYIEPVKEGELVKVLQHKVH